jgi:TPP-dependent pyruvate/acetoin dehydrogenase alpha subunit
MEVNMAADVNPLPVTDSRHTSGNSPVDPEEWLHMYRQMFRIRAFEEEVNGLYTRAQMPGLAHLYIGEEAVAVGICESLTREDYITSTHRGHGHCRGKGGSMHIADQEGGNLGANAIVGAGAGIATGAAFSAKWRNSGQVAVSFFGEGALGQGLIYEVMNMASLWKLPILYVCENNMYNEYTHYSETTAGELRGRPAAFGIPVEEVNGQDVREVYATARRLIEHARSGKGPAFMICNTYRYHGHHVGDINRAYYRSKEEELLWSTHRDPLKTLSGWLTEQHLADAGIFEQIETEAHNEMKAAVDFAVKAPFPDASEVTDHVYA